MLGSGEPSYSSVLRQIKLAAGDANPWDLFGASIAVSGDTVVIGAPWDDSAGDDTGSAYVFAHSAYGWVQVAKLTPADADADDFFGASVALDSGRIVVGARGDDEAGQDAGAAYVFVHDGTGWAQQAKLLPDQPGDAQAFGQSVAVRGDTIAVGALGDGFGAVSVFANTTAGWVHHAKLAAADGSPRDRFGASVALDGNTLLAGAPGDDDAGSLSGSAYVFTRANDVWTEQAKLVPDEGASQQFGQSVALDGSTAAIGAPGDGLYGQLPGAVYVFGQDTDGWSQQARLTGDVGESGQSFGVSVALEGDRLAVGAPFDAVMAPRAGAAHTFARTDAGWVRAGNVLSGDTEEADIFGSAVALDGDQLVVGAPFEDDGGNNSGSVYVFTPEETAPLVAPVQTLAAAGPSIQTLSTQPAAQTATAAQGFSATVDYGDGMGVQPLTLNPNGTFDLQHNYTQSGQFIVTVTVSDGEGGVGVDTLTVTVLSAQEQIVEVLIPDVEALVDAGTLNGGQGNSLISKLSGAIASLDVGNVNAGVNKLDAFINQVIALMNAGTLTPEEGQALIDAASAAIDAALGGSPSPASPAGAPANGFNQTQTLAALDFLLSGSDDDDNNLDVNKLNRQQTVNLLFS
jgi:hypothetical protein